MNFSQADIDVVITDVPTPKSADLYRRLLTDIVRIVVSFEEAQRRAATRKLF